MVTLKKPPMLFFLRALGFLDHLELMDHFMYNQFPNVGITVREIYRNAMLPIFTIIKISGIILSGLVDKEKSGFRQLRTE